MDLRKVHRDIRWIFKQQREAGKMLKPEIKYFKDVDILSIWFGGKGKVETSVEVEDILFDFNKNGVIIGLDINSFSRYTKDKKRGKIKEYGNKKKN